MPLFTSCNVTPVPGSRPLWSLAENFMQFRKGQRTNRWARPYVFIDLYLKIVFATHFPETLQWLPIIFRIKLKFLPWLDMACLWALNKVFCACVPSPDWVSATQLYAVLSDSPKEEKIPPPLYFCHSLLASIMILYYTGCTVTLDRKLLERVSLCILQFLDLYP